MKCAIVSGEDVGDIYAAMREGMNHSGPHAVVIRRKM